MLALHTLVCMPMPVCEREILFPLYHTCLLNSLAPSTQCKQECTMFKAILIPAGFMKRGK